MFRIVFLFLAVGFSSDAQLTKQELKVTAVLDEPWISKAKDSNTYQGFIIDILNKLGSRLNYTYSITLDDAYGYVDVTGKWKGAIGKLVNKEADLAAGPFAVNDKRAAVVDFSKPIQREGYRILIKKPTVHATPGLKVLFEPFSAGIWILILVVCIVVGIYLFIIDKFSPSEWSKVAPEDDPTNARTSFILANALFFVHSTVCWQGYKEVPRSPAGRILTSMWFSFIFFMIVAYTANLAAFLMAREPSQPIVPFKTFRQMELQTHVRYGFSGNGALSTSLQNSDDPMFKRLLNVMTSSGEGYASNSKLVDEVKSSDGKFAAILPSLTVKKVSAANCDLIGIGETVFTRNLAFACQKGTVLCSSISNEFLKLHENGEMFLLQKKWWPQGCPNVDTNQFLSRSEITLNTARPLSIADVSLAFIVLLIGVVFAAIFLVLEVCLHRRRSKKATLNESEQPVIMTTTNGGKSSAAEEGKDEEKAPMTVDEP